MDLFYFFIAAEVVVKVLVAEYRRKCHGSVCGCSRSKGSGRTFTLLVVATVGEVAVVVAVAGLVVLAVVVEGVVVVATVEMEPPSLGSVHLI